MYTEQNWQWRRKALISSTVLALAALMTATTARADVNCSGSVSEHLVYSDGSLMIRPSWHAGWIIVCSTQAPWKGVSTESCFTWFSMITSARLHNKGVGIYYLGDAPCSSFSTYYGAPGPVYVRMEP
jgi:hypothetical protein